MTSTTLRSARSGDEEVLADLNRFVQTIHIARRPDYFRPTWAADVAAWFEALLRNPVARIWIAIEEGRPAGYVLAFHYERPENPFCLARRWCEIDQIAVDPSRRRRGIARALIQEAIQNAAADGIRDVELSAWSFNDEAHETFRRLGFVPKAIRFELASERAK